MGFSMIQLKPADYKIQPWKNGLGTTKEIAIWPENAVEDFEWRISRAQVTENGPFSRFTGYDRLLILTHGDGLFLRQKDKVQEVGTDRSLQFSGDMPITAEIKNGPVKDFGAIYRHGVYHATLESVKIAGEPKAFALESDFIIYHCIEGGILIDYKQDSSFTSIQVETDETVIFKREGISAFESTEMANIYSSRDTARFLKLHFDKMAG